MAKITINVFDLTPLNKVVRCIKTGVYHTAINVDNREEWYFGFAGLGITGIDSPERLNQLPSCMSGTLYQSIEVGVSEFDYDTCAEIVRKWKKREEWLSDHYNVLFYNCNTFTRELCTVLLGKDGMGKFPSWVFRGVYLGGFVFSISMGHFYGLMSKKLSVLGEVPKVKRVKECAYGEAVIGNEEEGSATHHEDDEVDVESAFVNDNPVLSEGAEIEPERSPEKDEDDSSETD